MQFKKNLVNQYRVMINRTFGHKTVQLIGLPFCIQDFAKSDQTLTTVEILDKFVKIISFPT